MSFRFPAKMDLGQIFRKLCGSPIIEVFTGDKGSNRREE
jgi:hypothetical protein